jgi:hypothetical protein
MAGSYRFLSIADPAISVAPSLARLMLLRRFLFCRGIQPGDFPEACRDRKVIRRGVQSNVMSFDGQPHPADGFDFNQQRQTGKIAGAVAARDFSVPVGKRRTFFDHLTGMILSGLIGEHMSFGLSRQRHII